MLPSVQKYMVCVLGRSGRLAWWSSKPLLVGGGPALGPWPCQSPWLTTHTATLGSYCFLARPEWNGILIKTNSSRQNKGRPVAAHLGACFSPWLRGGAGVMKKAFTGTSLGRRPARCTARKWVEALGTPVGESGQGHPWATMLPLTLQSRKSWN